MLRSFSKWLGFIAAPFHRRFQRTSREKIVGLNFEALESRLALADVGAEGDWSTVYRDGFRTNYVPVVIGDLTSEPTWSRKTDGPWSPQTGGYGAIIANGRVFIPLENGIGAFDIDSGQEYWRMDIGNVSHLMYHDGVLFFLQLRDRWAVDANTGVAKWVSPSDFTNSTSHGFVSHGGVVYELVDRYRDWSLTGYRFADGKVVYYESSERPRWLLSNGKELFSHYRKQLVKHDQSPANSLWIQEFPNGFDENEDPQWVTRISSSMEMAVLGSGFQLSALNTETPGIRWKGDGVGQLFSISSSTIFLRSFHTVKEFQIGSGAFIREVQGFWEPIFATDDAYIAICEFPNKTCVVDRSTGEIRYTFPECGDVVIGNDTILFSWNGWIHAYHLSAKPNTMQIVLPSHVFEETKTSVGTIVLERSQPFSMVVTLDVDDSRVVKLPHSIYIPANRRIWDFEYQIENNSTPQENVRIKIEASAPGFYTAWKTMMVFDDDETVGFENETELSTRGYDPYASFLPGNVGRRPKPQKYWSSHLGLFSDCADKFLWASPQQIITTSAKDRSCIQSYDPGNERHLWKIEGFDIDHFSIQSGHLIGGAREKDGSQYLVSIELKTGIISWKAPWRSNFDGIIVEDQSVIVYGHFYNDLHSSLVAVFDLESGVERFSMTVLNRMRPPIHRNGSLYMIDDKTLLEVNSLEGAVTRQHSFKTNSEFRSLSVSKTHVFVSGNLGLDGDDATTEWPQLVAFDLRSFQVAWIFHANVVPHAIDESRLFVNRNDNTLVIDQETGRLLLHRRTGKGIFVSNDMILSYDPVAQHVTAAFDRTTGENTARNFPPMSFEMNRDFVGNGYVVTNESGLIEVYSFAPRLELSLPKFVTERNQWLPHSGSVSIPSPVSEDLVVHLTNSDPQRIQAPETVVIKAGTKSTIFDLYSTDNNQVNLAPITMTARANKHLRSTRTISMIDNEVAHFRVSIPERLRESMSATGIISTDAPVAVDTPVTIQVSTTEVVVTPVSLILRAGTSQVSFQIKAVDDNDEDGPISSRVRVESQGWTSDEPTIISEDNETPSIELGIPTTLVEGQKHELAVSIPYQLENDLHLLLSSSSPIIFANPIVTIPKGSLQSSTLVWSFNDQLVNGERRRSIEVSAPGFRTDTSEVEVLDDELARLKISAPKTIYEGDNSFVMRIDLENAGEHDLQLSLSASVRNLVVPNPVVVPSGQKEIYVPIGIREDRRVDGVQLVHLLGSIPNWTQAREKLTLVDNDRLGLSGEWQTARNGLAYSGFTPGYIGQTPRLRWNWSKVFADGSAVVAGNGLAYISTRLGSDTRIVALHPETGELAWQRDLIGLPNSSAPTFHEGSLFVQLGDGLANAKLLRLNALSGETIWEVSYPSDALRYSPPIVWQDTVMAFAGNQRGLKGWTVESGVEAFSIIGFGLGHWSPSIVDGKLVTWANGHLSEYSLLDGRNLKDTKLEVPWQPYVPTSHLLGDSNMVYLFDSSGLQAINLQSRQRLWMKLGYFTGLPAVAHDRLLVIEGDRVLAISGESGEEVMTFSVPDPIVGNLVATDDTLIVPTVSGTILFDLDTGLVKSRINDSGWISVANDRLFVMGDGTLNTYSINPRSALQNPLLPLDVNRDGVISSLDALRIINHLNARPNRGDNSDAGQTYFPDANGDFLVNALDVLLIINWLNKRSNGEGEASQCDAHLQSHFGMSLPTDVYDLENNRKDKHRFAWRREI